MGKRGRTRRSAAEIMPVGAVLSALLHASVIVIVVFGLPHFDEPPEFVPPIPIEVVIEDPVPEAEVAPEPPPSPEPEPEKLAEPEPEPETVPEPEPAPQIAALPLPRPERPAEPEPEPETEVEQQEAPQAEEEPVVEAAPEPEPAPSLETPPEPEAQPEPEPETASEPEPEKEPEVESAPEPEVAEERSEELTPPAPRRRPKVDVAQVEPEKEEPAPQVDRLTSILRNVEKLKDEPAPATRQNAELPTPRSQRQPSQLEVNEMVREIQKQMAACWRVEPGARDAQDLVVTIHVNLNPDGSVRVAKITDSQRMLSDDFFRSAAENARRAILRCSPFTLPPKKFDIWREMVLNFNPRQMFGG